jgi:hypothetical protein
MNILPTPTHAQVFYIKKDQIISGLFHSSYALLTYAQYVALLYFLKALALICQYDGYFYANCDQKASKVLRRRIS